MNKRYKVIWSKVKGCYVVVSELAKARTKSPSAKSLSKAMISGILACVMSFGIVMPSYATIAQGDTNPVTGGEIWQYLHGSSITEGSGSTASYDAVAIGHDTTAGYASVVIGPQSIGGSSAVAVGSGAKAASDSVAIGEGSASASSSVAVGIRAGFESLTETVPVAAQDAVAIGYESTVHIGGVSIGYHSTATARDAIAIGNESRATGLNSIVIGADSPSASGEYTITIGDNSHSDGEASIAIGKEAHVAHEGYTFPTIPQNGIAIGTSSASNGSNATAIGFDAMANGDDSIALGQGAMVGDVNDLTKGAYSIAVGRESSVAGENSIALGAFSTANEDNVVSVGVANNERRIINVAAGVNPTDAVNVSQLNAAIAGGGSGSGSSVSYIGINSASGSGNEDGSGAVGTDAIAIGKDVSVTGDNSIAIGIGHKVSGKNSGAFGDPNIIDGSNSYVIGNNSTVSDGDTDSSFIMGNESKTDTSETVIVGNSNRVAGGTNKIVVPSWDNVTVYPLEGEKNSVVGQSNDVAGSYNALIGNDNNLFGFDVNIVAMSKGVPYDAESPFQNSPVENNNVLGSKNVIASNNNLVAGNNSIVRYSENSISLGNENILVSNLNSDSAGTNNYSFGSANAITGSENIVIGDSNTVSGSLSLFVSDEDKPYYSNNVLENRIFGSTNNINGDNNLVLGDNITFTGDNAVIIGNGSTGVEGAVSVGNATTQRQIKYVAAGTADTDAVNVSQLNDAIAGAGSGTHYLGINTTSTTDANYNGETAVGLNSISIGRAGFDAGTADRVAGALKENSISIGNGTTAGGISAIAIGTGAIGGKNSSVAKDYSIAIGRDAKASIDRYATPVWTSGSGAVLASNKKGSAIALGSEAEAENMNSIAIGYDTSSKGTNSIMIGMTGRANGADSIGIGTSVQADASNSVSIGANSASRTSGGVSIGSGAINNGGVAIGNEAYAGAAGIVSFGHRAGDPAKSGTYSSAKTVRVINVADGTETHDVSTVNQTAYSIDLVDGSLVLKNVLNEELASVDVSQIGGSSYTAGNNISIENDVVSAVGLIRYDDETKSIATLEGGNRGTKLTNLKAGALTRTSTDAVIGNQLWQTNENLAGLRTDITTNTNNIASLNSSVTNALESVGSISGLVDTVNTLKADKSLNNLDDTGRQVIATAAANAVQEYMANNNKVVPVTMNKLLGKSVVLNKMVDGSEVVTYDDDSLETITLEGPIGIGTKVTNVANGELSAASMDAVNGAQLYAVQQQFDEFQSALSTNNSTIASVQTDVNTMKTNYLNLNSDVNTLKTQMETGFNVTIDGAKVKTVNPDSNMINFIAGDNVSLVNENGSVKISFSGTGAGGSDDSKANKDASNVSDYASEWGEAIGTGTVESGNSELVTGGTVYDALEDTKSELQDALDGKADKDDVYTKTETDTLLDEKANASDVYTKDETDTLLSDKADKSELDVKADITYVDEKLDIKADKDSVYTKDETDNLLDKKTDKKYVDDQLKKKANKDASNIEVDKWSEKLGVGKVEEGDTGLVNGGTVYEALQSVNGTDLIGQDNNEIRIGAKDKYDRLDSVNIAKSNGEGRYLRGVITDETDNTSAANVGYVKGVANEIATGVNQGFAKLDGKINKTGAGAAALANLHPMDTDGDTRWNMAASIGKYHGETAGAVGLFYKPSDRVMVNISSTVGNDDTMFGAGVSVALDKPLAQGLSKVEMAKTINAQNAQINAMQKEMQAERQLMMQKINELEAKVEKLESQK